MQQADLDNLRDIIRQWCEDCDSSDDGAEMADSLFAKVQGLVDANAAMLAALQEAVAWLERVPVGVACKANPGAANLEAMREVIALATGTPTGEQAPRDLTERQAAAIDAARGYVADSDMFNAPTPEQVSELLAMAGIDAAPTGEAAGEWSGAPCDHAPDSAWHDDATGEHVDAVTGERGPCPHAAPTDETGER